MPALEALQDRFLSAHTQALAISVDSVHSHANFGASRGGISYPMLADFHPKGELGQKLGVYVEAAGLDARSTVIIDADGVVQHASMVPPGGIRDMAELAALCEEIDKKYQGTLAELPSTPGLDPSAVLYVKDNCAASRAALLARTNLHLDDLEVKNVSQDPSALAELEKKSGAQTAPVLVTNDAVTAESSKIVSALIAACSPL